MPGPAEPLVRRDSLAELLRQHEAKKSTSKPQPAASPAAKTPKEREPEPIVLTPTTRSNGSPRESARELDAEGAEELGRDIASTAVRTALELHDLGSRVAADAIMLALSSRDSEPLSPVALSTVPQAPPAPPPRGATEAPPAPPPRGSAASAAPPAPPPRGAGAASRAAPPAPPPRRHSAPPPPPPRNGKTPPVSPAALAPKAPAAASIMHGAPSAAGASTVSARQSASTALSPTRRNGLAVSFAVIALASCLLLLSAVLSGAILTPPPHSPEAVAPLARPSGLAALTRLRPTLKAAALTKLRPPVNVSAIHSLGPRLLNSALSQGAKVNLTAIGLAASGVGPTLGGLMEAWLRAAASIVAPIIPALGKFGLWTADVAGKAGGWIGDVAGKVSSAAAAWAAVMATILVNFTSGLFEGLAVSGQAFSVWASLADGFTSDVAGKLAAVTTDVVAKAGEAGAVSTQAVLNATSQLAFLPPLVARTATIGGAKASAFAAMAGKQLGYFADDATARAAAFGETAGQQIGSLTSNATTRAKVFGAVAGMRARYLAANATAGAKVFGAVGGKQLGRAAVRAKALGAKAGALVANATAGAKVFAAAAGKQARYLVANSTVAAVALSATARKHLRQLRSNTTAVHSPIVDGAKTEDPPSSPTSSISWFY